MCKLNQITFSSFISKHKLIELQILQQCMILIQLGKKFYFIISEGYGFSFIKFIIIYMQCIKFALFRNYTPVRWFYESVDVQKMFGVAML